MNNEDSKKLFEDIAYSNIHRKGITSLMVWLAEETDFFSAPASTKYHGSYKGGLLDHSLEVYAEFLKIAPVFSYDLSNNILKESATIVTLFHDVCKINTYEESVRNVKNPETGIWESVPCYIYSPNADPYCAHGASSVFHITQHMDLDFLESMAIYHHMGMWDAGKYDNIGKAYETNKLAWLLHVADEAATYIAGI